MRRVIPIASAWVISVLVCAFLLAPYVGPAAEQLQSGTLTHPDWPSVPPGPASVARDFGLAGAPAPPPSAHVSAHADAGEIASPSAAPADTAAPSPLAAAPSRQSRTHLLTASAIGILEIHVVDAQGAPASAGEVYALSAGERQAPNNGNFFSASLMGTDGRTVLHVPSGHPFDVGYVGPGGHVLATGVTAPPGGALQLELRPPRGEPITVELGTFPAGAAGSTVRIYLEPEENERAVDYPGRDEAAVGWDIDFTTSRAGTVTSPPVPPGRYEISASVERPAPGTGPAPSVRYTLEPDSEQVEPGGRVRLQWNALATLRLTVFAAGVGSAKDRCTVIAVREGAPRNEFQYVSRVLFKALQSAPDGVTVHAYLAPGTYHLEWGGAKVAQGRSAAFTLAAGRVVEQSVSAAFGPSPSAGDPSLRYIAARLATHAAPARAPASAARDVAEQDPAPIKVIVPADARESAVVDGASVRLHFAFAPGPDGEVIGYYTEVFEDDPEVLLAADEFRSMLPVVATRGGTLASRPMPPAGPYEPTLLPAGVLVLIPAAPPVAPAGGGEMPPLTIAREDGAALPFSSGTSSLHSSPLSDYVPGDSRSRVDLKIGVVLGPLPAGPQRFVIRRGSVVLGTVEAQIEAGAVRALEIR